MLPKWASIVCGFFLIAFVYSIYMTSPANSDTTSKEEKRLTEGATFGGGCFWCMEPPFDKVIGVWDTTSGYMGGGEEEASYKKVSSGATDHVEVLHVRFDPETVTYEELLDVYWRNSDPTTSGRQFCDVGKQYRPVIFYHSEEQKEAAQKSMIAAQGKLQVDKKIVTSIEPALTFYPAEDYHQDYYKKNPDNYYRYRRGCGRDARLQELWGKTTKNAH